MRKALAALVVALAPAAGAAPPGVNAGPPEPPLVQQVRGIGLNRCAAVVAKMSQVRVDTPAAAPQSGWYSADPSHHTFQSVVGLKYPQTGAQALAAIIAAPQGEAGCDGTLVQVYPVGQPCDQVRASIATGKDIADLQGVRVVVDANATRVFLVPGANATCVVVSAIAFYQH